MTSIREQLSVNVSTRIARMVFANTSAILGSFGFNRADPTQVDRIVPGRETAWDVFNDTRKVARPSAPNATSKTRNRHPIGKVNVTIPRFREKLPIPLEKVHEQRVLGTNNDRDTLGAAYIGQQQAQFARYFTNAAVLLVAGMMRGALYAHGTGEEEYYDFVSTDATYTVDWRIPDRNKGRLTGFEDPVGAASTPLIDKPWSDRTADIPRHITVIDKGMQRDVGTRLDVIKLSSVAFDHVLNNDAIVSRAGIGQTAFTEFSREVGTNPENGQPVTIKRATLRGIPYIQWEISDEVLDVGAYGSEANTQLIPDTHAWFGPFPRRDVFELIGGTEPFVPGNGRPPQVGSVLYSYGVTTHDPAGFEIHTGLNMIPALIVPAATAWAEIIF